VCTNLFAVIGYLMLFVGEHMNEIPPRDFSTRVNPSRLSLRTTLTTPGQYEVATELLQTFGCSQIGQWRVWAMQIQYISSSHVSKAELGYFPGDESQLRATKISLILAAQKCIIVDYIIYVILLDIIG